MLPVRPAPPPQKPTQRQQRRQGDKQAEKNGGHRRGGRRTPSPARRGATPTQTAEVEFQYHAHMAWQAYTKKRWPQAVKHLDTALALNPRDLRCLEMRCQCRREVGQLDGALHDADTMLEIENNVVVGGTAKREEEDDNNEVNAVSTTATDVAKKSKTSSPPSQKKDRHESPTRAKQYATVRPLKAPYKGLLERAKTLYSMGRFEESLVLHHRGNKLRPDIAHFKQGIAAATELVQSALQRNVPSLSSSVLNHEDSMGGEQDDQRSIAEPDENNDNIKIIATINSVATTPRSQSPRRAHRPRRFWAHLHACCEDAELLERLQDDTAFSNDKRNINNVFAESVALNALNHPSNVNVRTHWRHGEDPRVARFPKDVRDDPATGMISREKNNEMRDLVHSTVEYLKKRRHFWEQQAVENPAPPRIVPRAHPKDVRAIVARRKEEALSVRRPHTAAGPDVRSATSMSNTRQAAATPTVASRPKGPFGATYRSICHHHARMQTIDPVPPREKPRIGRTHPYVAAVLEQEEDADAEADENNQRQQCVRTFSPALCNHMRATMYGDAASGLDTYSRAQKTIISDVKSAAQKRQGHSYIDCLRDNTCTPVFTTDEEVYDSVASWYARGDAVLAKGTDADIRLRPPVPKFVGFKFEPGQSEGTGKNIKHTYSSLLHLYDGKEVLGDDVDSVDDMTDDDSSADDAPKKGGGPDGEGRDDDGPTLLPTRFLRGGKDSRRKVSVSTSALSVDERDIPEHPLAESVLRNIHSHVATGDLYHAIAEVRHSLKHLELQTEDSSSTKLMCDVLDIYAKLSDAVGNTVVAHKAYARIMTLATAFHLTDTKERVLASLASLHVKVEVPSKVPEKHIQRSSPVKRRSKLL